MSFVLLNSGDKLLLNSGDGVLLNGITIGMQIIGTHPTQQTIQRKPEQLYKVQFTFWLKSKLLRRVTLELLGEVIEKLKPGLLYTNDLRYSFQLPITALRDKVAPALKRFHQKMELESIIAQAENDPNEFLLSLASLIKKMEKKLDRD